MTLSQVRREAAGNVYPDWVFDGLDRDADVLFLFSAGFHGAQDVVFAADAGIRSVTCIDEDSVKLDEMRQAYPPQWEFLLGDVFDYADGFADAGWQWDVVSLDPPTNQFRRCEDLLGLWCQLARKHVVIGCGQNDLDAPDGWQVLDRISRSDYAGGVAWTVLGQ